MSFDQSPFAKSLYLSGTPKKPGSNDSNNEQSPSTPFSSTSSPKRTPIRQITGSRDSQSPKTPQSGVGSASKFSTPNAFKPSTPSQIPTGSWEHPSLKDIRKRTVNKELMIHKLLINGGILIALYLFSRGNNTAQLNNWFGFITHKYPQILTYSRYLYIGIQLLCFYNVLVSVSSLFEPKEKYDDLPITPNQRKLLGLPESPNSAKSSPSPPKYLKSSPQARVSPRPSPLSKSSSSPLSKSGQPITSSPNTPTNYSNNNNQQSVDKSNILNSSDSPNSTTGSTFTPTGRYLYMTDSPNRRTSFRKFQ